MEWKRILFLIGGLMLLELALTACGPEATPVPPPPCPTSAPCPTPEVPEPGVEVPFEQLWAGSGHADATAEAFKHWNTADPQEIPANCAKCHSTPGYLDFLGMDGTEAGKVDKAAPIGTVITCVACHNEATQKMTSVTFPSGAEITGLGPEARCMQCHQGRSSGPTVDKALTKLTDPDVVSPTLAFQNIHYFAAAATLYGTLAQGGYQYPGQTYDARLDHVEGYNTCVGCHNSHTLEVKVERCAMCHEGVTKETLRDIRMVSSAVDYDGDGDVTEGIAREIEGLQALLLQNIQAYGAQVAGKPIGYTPEAYPYWYGDTNSDGVISAGEITTTNRYNAWTPRLLKAAYNYQVSIKDPGAFAHGGKYIIELLYDSIASLNEKVAAPIDMTKLHRIDAGHFAGSEEAFRHWDEEGEVATACVKCHSGVGLPMYLKNGATIAVEPSNGLLCITCHDEANWPARYAIAEVTFPSGKKATFGENADANLCISCHQGRESTVSVNNAIRGKEEDTVDAALRFRNVHYFAAGATLFGGDVQGAYQYEGKEYVGRFAHTAGIDNCLACHDTHGLTVKVETCACHGIQSEEDLAKIRMSTVDYDGDGDTSEGIAGEIATYQEKLLAAIQDYAQNVAGAPISYDAHTYPYFLGADGKAYAAWTPRLLKAAYNYQYSQKDPGAFAHNAKYIIQTLYDSLESLGQKVTVDMAGMIRP